MLTDPTTLNLTDPAFKANPFPTLAYLRENAPVLRLPGRHGKGHLWLITRYKDAVAVLKDERITKDEKVVMSPEELAQASANITSLMLLENEGETHRRLRGLVYKVFTPQFIEPLRERIRTICAELLDRATAQGKLDLVNGYAFPITATVISELLGVPGEGIEQIGKWTKVLMSQSYGPDLAESHQAMLCMLDYLRSVIDTRRSQPKDDLISRLLQADESGDKLTADELLAMTFMLLIAGHETTVTLITNGAMALMEHPAQLQKLREDPSLIKSAVEELLRFTGSADNALPRFAAQDVEVNGVVIPRGDMVLVSLASVNRDPEQFDNPDTLDITRANNKHIGLGSGAHYCLGAALARMQASIAFLSLCERMPNLKLAIDPSELQWRPALFVRSLEALPVTF